MQAIIITMFLHLADNAGWTDMRPIKMVSSSETSGRLPANSHKPGKLL